MNQKTTADCDQLLHELSTRQYLFPHASIRASLARMVDDLGICPVAIEQSITWLQLDAAKSIGRLRRTELMQLARTVHRVWQQRLSDVAATA